MKNIRRFKDIINANINATLNKAENPEKMIRFMIQEMEETLIDLKSSCAAKIADKTRLDQELKSIKAVVTRWKNRAELAVEKGKDELAREALAEKMKAERSMNSLQENLTKLDAIISECRANITKLEERLQTVRDKQQILIQRGIHAQETILAKEKMREADGTEAYRRFSDLEQRIERMEAEAEMAGFGTDPAKEDLFFKMESEDEIEEELAKLKKTMVSKKA